MNCTREFRDIIISGGVRLETGVGRTTALHGVSLPHTHICSCLFLHALSTDVSGKCI